MQPIPEYKVKGQRSWIATTWLLPWRRGEALYWAGGFQSIDECPQLAAHGFQQAQLLLDLAQSTSGDYRHGFHLARSFNFC